MPRVEQGSNVPVGAQLPDGWYYLHNSKVVEKTNVQTQWGPKTYWFWVYVPVAEMLDESNPRVALPEVPAGFDCWEDLTIRTNNKYGNSDAALTKFLNRLFASEEAAQDFTTRIQDTDKIAGHEILAYVSHKHENGKVYTNVEEWSPTVGIVEYAANRFSRNRRQPTPDETPSQPETVTIPAPTVGDADTEGLSDPFAEEEATASAKSRRK